MEVKGFIQHLRLMDADLPNAGLQLAQEIYVDLVLHIIYKKQYLADARKYILDQGPVQTN